MFLFCDVLFVLSLIPSLATPISGLPDRVADANQRKWIHNDVDDGGKEAKVDCIVATIAFGMGIDKVKSCPRFRSHSLLY